MKATRQFKSNQVWSKWAKLEWKHSALALILLATLAGCGDKGGDGGGTTAVVPTPTTPAVNPGGYYCSTCPNGMSLLTSAVGKSPVYQAEVTMEFYATTPTNVSSVPSEGFYSQSSNYYGEFSAEGSLFFYQPYSYCNIPTGAYQLRTVKPGIWGRDGDGRSMEGVIMEASGNNITFSVSLNGYIDNASPAARSNDGRMFPNTIVGRLYFGTGSAINSSCYVNLY